MNNLTGLNVSIKENASEYQIVFKNSFGELPEMIKSVTHANKVLIVTDSNVGKFYGNEIQTLLTEAGFEAFKYSFEAGEHSKNLNTVSLIYDACLEHKLDRGSAIIALGGGVVGDMAGFAAASYMRGISFIQVPTSLLAQVDSSVGGKVGVDYNNTKNIIGAFHQPILVYINISSLATLPRREFISGLAEVIKHGIIYDCDFFEYLENNIDNILCLDDEVLRHIIYKNCYIKSQVVEQDEREQGLRAILNFGHTIGHAIESVKNFTMLHGECVSIGINAACYMAVRTNLLSKDDMNRIIKLLELVGLPVYVDNINIDLVYEELLKDKKRTSSKIKFIIPTRIGKVIQTTKIDKKTIYESIHYVLK